MSNLLSTISLQGLEIAPSQIWGAVRLVPLLRRQSRRDLQLTQRNYHYNPMVALDKRMQYYSYIPHGLVLQWTNDGSPIAAAGCQVGKQGKEHSGMVVLRRMAKREEPNSVRFLPLHLAMEGFLSMFFKAPAIIWSEYSRKSSIEGFSERTEYSATGRSISDLSEALRVFEIHENQVGVLLFVGEALASAFILPSPADYRSLHNTLLNDFYGQTFYYYGLYGQANELKMEIDTSGVRDLTDLRRALQKLRQDWAKVQGEMAGDLIDRPIQSQQVYQAGPFSLQRFITDLDRTQTNYIGESIVDNSGSLQYLKIYGLSAAQTRRTHLLQQLAANQWHLENTAIALNTTLPDLMKRIEKVGLGYIFNNQLREQHRKLQRG
jgi:hypothetical protein